MTHAPLSVRSRLAYGLGDVGQNILFQITVFHLLFFLTEEAGISSVFAGSLFLLARIWDGINDPIMGYLAARTSTRWGSYRPYLLWGAPLIGLSLYLLFAIPEGSPAFREGYVALTYLFYGMVFTLFNIPYGSLTAVMTSSYEERGILTGYRMTFAMAGGLLGATAFLPVVRAFGGGATGYALAAALFGLLVWLFSMPTFFGVRERLRIQPEEKPRPRQAWSYLQRNTPFWWLCMAFGTTFAAYALYAASLPYAAKYLFQRETLTVPLVLTLMAITGLAVPAWTWASGRIGKKKVFLFGSAGYFLGFLLLGLLPAHADPALLYLALAIQGIGNGAAAYTSWAMLPDTVEFGQWKTGMSAPGLVYGVYGFFFKLGLGIGSALAGGLVAWAGIQATGGAISPGWIRAGISWLPMGMMALAWLAIWRYPITSALHAEIRDYLAAAD